MVRGHVGSYSRGMMPGMRPCTGDVLVGVLASAPRGNIRDMATVV